MKHLSVVGKGCHTDEKRTGFYNTGDRMAFWGKSGAFWSPHTDRLTRWRGPRPSSARSAPRASIFTTARLTCS